ncbi:MAG: thiamine pyrophosphate-binding protein, partial [Alicyclobacillus sp.]|nr:thiamine pyrophosphate-binding protein [Alicyclobacillus sp.]
MLRVLQQEGIRYVFGLPGTTIMHILDQLAQQTDVRYLSVRHEQSAAFMADGYFRGSGQLAACLASRGPGAANMTSAVHNAYAESIPLLAIVGQVADEYFHREAFEEMDLVRFYEPITKWSVEVHHAERIPELVQRAIRTAVSGRPRPVLVSIPLDVQTQALPKLPALQPRVRPAAPVPAQGDLEQALHLLAHAERPVLLLGGGAQAFATAPELAETLAMPVLTSWLRKDAFPNSHPAYLGTLGFGAYSVSEEAIRSADVLLAVGCHFSEFTTKQWTLLSPQTQLIHLDIDPLELGKVYPPVLGLQGDAAASLQRLLALAQSSTLDTDRLHRRRQRLHDLRAQMNEETKMPPAAQRTPVPSQALIDVLQRYLDQRAHNLVLDAPTFGVWAQRYLRVDRPGCYFSAAGGSMGWGLPAAMGIQLARPQERVLAICGDGSFWMVAQDFETAVREKIPVVCIITNNFAYGNTRDRQKNAHGGRYLGVFHHNPDFAAFARLLGGYGERVE